jgi:hypothetical protein
MSSPTEHPRELGAAAAAFEVSADIVVAAAAASMIRLEQL